MGTTDLVAMHRRSVEAFVARVQAVRDHQWADPTPCAEWSVRDLVNHVVGEDFWTEPILRGRTIEEVGDAFDGDLLGDRPAAVAAEAGDRAVRAAAERVPRGGTVHLSYGEEQVEEYLWQLTADHLVHGWDLAAGTGADARLESGLVEAVAAWFTRVEEQYRSAGAIGERVPVESEDPQDRLLGRFGRDPAWAAHRQRA